MSKLLFRSEEVFKGNPPYPLLYWNNKICPRNL